MTRDEEHLNLLSIFHYIVGGLVGFGSLIPIIHLVVGLCFIFAPGSFESESGAAGPPAFLGWFFVIFAGLFITAGLSCAVCVIVAGRCLALRKRHMFCLVMAAIECIFMPFGTVLGVFTIIVLSRESVQELFATGKGVQPNAPAG
jgi:hypothetical protein